MRWRKWAFGVLVILATLILAAALELESSAWARAGGGMVLREPWKPEFLSPIHAAGNGSISDTGNDAEPGWASGNGLR